MSVLSRVSVLAGGLSHERDVSLRSGRRVAEALRDVGIDVDVHDVDSSLIATLRAERPDAVVPLLHGVSGEDGSLRSVLEMLGIPYVGATPSACRVAFDKATAKTLVSAAGVATPDYVALPHETFRELGADTLLRAIIRRLGLPVVVKPVRGGSALGASVVREMEDLTQAMVGAFAYGDTAMVEAFVEGVEVAVSVVDTGDGPRVLPVVEIVPDGGFYDYTTRYTAGMTEFFVPARLTDACAAAAADTALAAHTALRLRDLSRTDMIVDAQGRAQFLEVNVAPGMTETSLLPMAARAGGFDLGLLYRDLAAGAAARG